MYTQNRHNQPAAKYLFLYYNGLSKEKRIILSLVFSNLHKLMHQYFHFPHL